MKKTRITNAISALLLGCCGIGHARRPIFSTDINYVASKRVCCVHITSAHIYWSWGIIAQCLSRIVINYAG